MTGKSILLKIFTMILVLMFLLTTLTACGGASKPATEEKKADAPAAAQTTAEQKPAAQAPAAQTPAAPQKVIEIRFSDTLTAGDIRHEPMNKLVEKFNKEHPGWKVTHEALPSAEIRTKMTVEMAAGNPANVSWAPVSYAREFMRDNKVLDWRVAFDDPKHPEFRKWLSKKAIDANDYGDGRIMMCPNGVNMDGFFYNTEIFNKYGWQPPKTWEELIDLSKKAKEKGITAMVTGGKDMRFAWQVSALMLRTAGYKKTNALALGPNFTDWNKPEFGFVDAMKKWKQLVDAGAFPEGVLALSRDEADQAFAKGEAAMYYEGQWIPGNLIKIKGKDWVEKNVRRVDFPVMNDMPNGSPKANVGGGITGLIANAKQPKEQLEVSIEWVKAHLDPAVNKEWVEMGAMIYAGPLEYDRTKCVTVYNQMVDAALASEYLIPSMDGLAAPNIDLAIKRDAMPGIITGGLNVDQAVAVVQKAAEEYAKGLKK